MQYRYIGTTVTGTPNPFLDIDNWEESANKAIVQRKLRTDYYLKIEDIIPNGYVGLEYINGVTGNSRIDTGIVCADDIEVECTFQDNRWLSYAPFFGRYTDDDTDALRLICSYSNTSQGLVNLNTKASPASLVSGLVPATKHHVILNKTKFVIDGVSTTLTASTQGTAQDGTIVINGTDLTASTELGRNISWYNFVIRKNGIAVFNGIPCKRILDGAVGLYDTVGNQFLTNALNNSVNFVAGPYGAQSQLSIDKVDDEPIESSDNLVKSGGVAKQINSMSTELSALNIVIVPPSANLLDMSKAVTGRVSSSDGTLDSSIYQYKTSDYFAVSNKYNWYYCANSSYCNVAFYDENKQFLYGQDNIPYSTSRKITNQNVKYARVSYPSSYDAFFYVSQTLWTEAPVYEQYHAASVTIHCDIQGNVYGDVYGNIQGINLDGGEIDLGGGLIRLNNGKIIIGKSDATVTVSDKLHHLISIGQNAASDAVSRAIAIGTNALASSTAATNSDNGHYNVAIGHNSMQSSTTGNHNTAVGWGTMIDLTTGTGNTACGEDALCHTVIGSNNTAVGNRAMQTATGNGNVAIGSLAMYSNSQSVPNGNFNVAIGASSGCSDTGDGDNNTAIGHGAGCSSQYRYTTAIGAGAHATKSRQVVIGSTESGTPHPLETILNGDIVVLGTDMVARKLVFNQDGSIGWTEVTLQ